MTTVLLIRHGTTDAVGLSLAGRIAGLDLSDAGRRQTGQLRERLANTDVRAVYSSPLERALQTAAPSV